MVKRKSKHPAGLGSVRIIAGKHRGRRLTFPLTDGVRPTPDRVRETLFNWLAGSIEGANCLDLFCGSGALGIEALSRSAAFVTFVDSSAPIIDHLQNQLSKFGESAAVHREKAMVWLTEQPDTALYDIVFLDPPFNKGALSAICQAIAAKQIVKSGGVIYIEAEAALASLPIPPEWQIDKAKRTGDVQFVLCSVA